MASCTSHLLAVSFSKNSLIYRFYEKHHPFTARANLWSLCFQFFCHFFCPHMLSSAASTHLTALTITERCLEPQLYLSSFSKLRDSALGLQHTENLIFFTEKNSDNIIVFIWKKKKKNHPNPNQKTFSSGKTYPKLKKGWFSLTNNT